MAIAGFVAGRGDAGFGAGQRRQHGFERDAVGQIEVPLGAVGGQRCQPVPRQGNLHFHGLLAAFGARHGGVEEAGDLFGRRSQAHIIETGRGGGIRDAGKQPDQPHHDQHFDQGDAAAVAGSSSFEKSNLSHG